MTKYQNSFQCQIGFGEWVAAAKTDFSGTFRLHYFYVLIRENRPKKATYSTIVPYASQHYDVQSDRHGSSTGS